MASPKIANGKNTLEIGCSLAYTLPVALVISSYMAWIPCKVIMRVPTVDVENTEML
jgi:hypothetical protein